MADFDTYFVGEYGVLVHNYIGENGQKVDSKTTWQNGKTERIDIENPGGRDGNIHYHDPNNIKYYYDIVSESFPDLSKNEIKKLYKKAGFKEGLEKALKYLGIK